MCLLCRWEWHPASGKPPISKDIRVLLLERSRTLLALELIRFHIESHGEAPHALCNLHHQPLFVDAYRLEILMQRVEKCLKGRIHSREKRARDARTLGKTLGTLARK